MCIILQFKNENGKTLLQFPYSMMNDALIVYARFVNCGEKIVLTFTHELENETP